MFELSDRADLSIPKRLGRSQSLVSKSCEYPNLLGVKLKSPQIEPTRMTRLSDRHVVAIAVGALLVVLGVLEYLSMEPGVIAGNLQNADVMSAILGIQLFSGFLLMAYGTITHSP